MKRPITLLLLILAQFAQAQTSNENPKLKIALEHFPDADANKDNKLTIEEAKAYRAAHPQLGRKQKADTDGKAGEENGDEGVSEALLKLYEARMFEGVPYRLHYELPV